jgi:hypothetical protein
MLNEVSEETRFELAVAERSLRQSEQGNTTTLIPSAYGAWAFCSFLIQAPNPSASGRQLMPKTGLETDPGYCSSTKRGAG